MKAYKVFKRQSNGSLVSAGSIPSFLVYRYRKNQWNIPTVPRSKFFCFASLDDAQKFKSHREGVAAAYEIWEVEVPSLKPTQKAVTVWNCSSSSPDYYLKQLRQAVKSFWHYTTNEQGKMRGRLTANVSLASRVKLVRKVA